MKLADVVTDQFCTNGLLVNKCIISKGYIEERTSIPFWIIYNTHGYRVMPLTHFYL